MAKAAEISKSVCPSGVALATVFAASVPPAPGRFSTTTGCPQRSPSLGPIMRAEMSVALPAENGTTMRTGLLGNFCCACAKIGVAIEARPAAIALANAISRKARIPPYSSRRRRAEPPIPARGTRPLRGRAPPFSPDPYLFLAISSEAHPCNLGWRFRQLQCWGSPIWN